MAKVLTMIMKSRLKWNRSFNPKTRFCLYHWYWKTSVTLQVLKSQWWLRWEV